MTRTTINQLYCVAHFVPYVLKKKKWKKEKNVKLNAHTKSNSFLLDFSFCFVFFRNGYSNLNLISISIPFRLLLCNLSILFLCLRWTDNDNSIRYVMSAIENQNSNYFNSFSYNNNSTNLNNGNANTQWSVWQQFPWPYIQPEQNRWSKCLGFWLFILCFC